MTGTSWPLVRVVHGPDLGNCALIDQTTVVGRGVEPLELTDSRVSRQHLELAPVADGVSVRDLGSAGGTTVRGGTIATGRVVPAGETIELGATVLRVLHVARTDGRERSDFVLHRGRSTFDIAPRAEHTIGRDASCSIVIDDLTISRAHARLVQDRSSWVLSDERSANGTFVNGQRVTNSHRLSRGDELTFGTSDSMIIYTPLPVPGDVRVRLGSEGDTQRVAVTISAPAGSTVGDVLQRCVDYLGLQYDDSHLLVRVRSGLMLPPDLLWSSCGIVDGDELVVAVGDIPPGVIQIDVMPAPARSAVNQLPRTVHRPVPHTVRAPETPDSTRLRGRGVIWQVIGGLVAVSGGLALAFVRPEFWIFGVIMGVVGITSVSVSVAADQARRHRRLDDYHRRIVAIDAELAAVRAAQAMALSAVSPDDGTLTEIVTRRSARLWERRLDHPDALMMRLGTGRSQTALTVEQSSFHQYGRHEGHEFDEVLAIHRTLTDVPVCLPGRSVELVGIVGPRALALDAVGRVIVEAAALHPPDQLRIWVLAANDVWGWCRWLPHVVDDSRCSLSRSAEEANALALELAQLFHQPNRGGSPAADPGELHLIIATHDALRLPNVTELLRTGPRGHGQVLAVADDVRDLPSGVGSLVTLGADGTGVIEGAHPDPPIGRFEQMCTPFASSVRLAREFGSMTLARMGPQSSSAGLVELATGTTLGGLDVALTWTRHHDWMAAPIGLADDGSPVVLDFRRDGPHGMIAGTTGSGKSELLQTLLAGLALTHDPTALNLFLIDFKGGATFSPLARLPHVVGVVTDLENATDLAPRAFAALDAEIERRKRLLDAANVPNIIDYERLPEAAEQPLANLLVVIDEFALLMKQQPDLRDRLDTVATQGRSLGVHLLLATQSPSGVVTNAIRTNTNLWICLRVVSDAESTELLGRRDAARIPTGQPGRGYVRKGASESLAGFQAARIARDLDHGATSVVQIRPFADDRPPTTSIAARRPAGRRLTELDVMVDRIVSSFETSGAAPARTLWSTPLPLALAADDIAPVALDQRHLVAVLGNVDLPRRQQVEAATIDLSANGHAMVLGVLGSGRSTALRQFALDLAERWSPADLHIYAFDAGAGSLGGLTRLSHTAGVIGSGDEERMTRAIGRLHRAMEARRAELGRAGTGDFLTWRSEQPTGAPWLLVVIDDYATFRQTVEQLDNGRVHDQFTSLVNGGPAVGIHVTVATAQMNDMRLSHANLFGARVVMRPSDPTDFQLIDQRVKAEQYVAWPPGRGMLRGGHQLQVALPTPERIDAVAARWQDVDPACLPRPVDRLPQELEYSDVPTPADMPPGSIVLGLGGDDGDPVIVDFERGGGTLLVIGPNQSGRTTTLRSVMSSVSAREDATVFGLVAPRHNDLRTLAGHPHVEFVASTPDEINSALTALATRTGPALVVLIDDAELLTMAAPDPLEAALRNAATSGIRFVVAARTTDLQSMYEPWARYIQTHRFALALQAGPPEAYLLGVRAVAEQAPIPGRGLLHERGRLRPVQVHHSQPDPFSNS